MDDQNMTITYDNKFTDVLYFALNHYTHSPYMIGLLLVTFIMRNMQIISAVIYNPDLPASTVAVSLLIDGIIWTSFFLILLPVITFITFYSKKNKSMFTSFKLSLLQNSLIEENPYGKVEVNYPAIIKICDTKKHLIIYRTKAGGIIVPKRIFNSEAQWKSFYNILMEKYTKASIK